MATSEHHLRRVALLIASLDRNTADKLLDQFPVDRAREVRDALFSLSDIDETEQSTVIREFLRSNSRCPTPDQSQGRAQRLAENRPPVGADLGTIPVGEYLDVSDDEPETGEKPLERASERLIAECLGDELPQAIAVALAQLPTRRASEVVAHLPASLQSQVLERLVEFDPNHSVYAPDIRDEFYQWLNEQIERSLHRAELATRLATILDATHSGTRQQILHNVSNSDARLAKELQHQLAALGTSTE